MTGLVAAQTIQGCIEGLYGDLLHGWVIDSTHPDLRVVVELYLDDAFIGLCRADQPQAHRDNIPGDGLHGFSFPISRAWLNQANSIAVRVANQGPWLKGRIDLQGWSASLTAQADTDTRSADSDVTPDSCVLHDGGLLIQGWAIDPDEPDRHVGILVREGRVIQAQTVANIPHPELVKRRTADHGFKLSLPWSLADGNVHDLYLETDRGQRLLDTPLSVCLRPEGFAATLQKLWPGTQKSRQQPPFNLLLRLAREQERRAPQSLPFTAYPDWFDVQQQDPLPAYDKASASVGALLLNEADASAPGLDATVNSLRRQTVKIQHIEQVPVTQALAGLAHLLGQGVTAVVVIMTGDHLAPQALPRLLAGLQAHKNAANPAWIYADCDQDDEQGKRCNPWLKPAWDPDFFLGCDIFTVGAVYSADILRQALDYLAAHRPVASSNAGHWHYLACALVMVTQQTQALVAHLPLVLYHRAAGQPADPGQFPADPARKAALQWLTTQMDEHAKVSSVPDFPGLMRVQWSVPAPQPQVSLIIPTRDQYALLKRCLDSLKRYTRYDNIEFIVVDNDSQCERTLRYLDQLAEQGVKIIRYAHAFNYAAINNLAVTAASGSLIALVNNDIEIAADQGEWLSEMVSQLLRPGVGAVGAKLQWPNGMVQHGGVVVGINTLAAHVGNHWMHSDPGYLAINQIVRRQSAVTAACLLTSKAAWDSVGGLNARDFAVNFNDVDFCLRLRRAGYAVIWTAFATLVHAESASRGRDLDKSNASRSRREQQNLRLHWTHHLAVDPTYHPGLSMSQSVGAYSGLKLPPNPGQLRFADIT